MKLGVVGKGGTGKTTISGLLCRTFAERGERVLAVDTDSNPNLAMSLGLGEEAANTAPILPRALVVGPGNGEMTPSELLGEYALATPSGVTLLHAMRVSDAGAGCTCTSHATVRSLLGAAIEDEADVTLVDMEAGLEHLSRAGGTLAYADVLLVVMEPTQKSVMTAVRTLALARELGIPKIAGVGNKARGPDDAAVFETLFRDHGLPLAAVVPFDATVPESDKRGTPLPAGAAEPVRRAIDKVVAFVDAAGADLNAHQAERVALKREGDRIQIRLQQLGAG